MRTVSCILVTCFVLVLIASFSRPNATSIGVAPAVIFIKAESEKFASSAIELEAAISSIRENNPGTVVKAREALRNCRRN